MESFKQFFDAFLFYAGLYLGYIVEGIEYLWNELCIYIESAIVPALPTVLKIFSNRTINLVIFVVAAAFFLIMNICAFTMFGADKNKAKRQRNRISEKKLFRVCFFGGAVGGFIGMLCFNHKTRKKRFYILIPILFIIQVVLESFIIGFLGFWGFFY